MPTMTYVIGTLVWYYYIVQGGLANGQQLTPDEDDPNVDLGRFIGKTPTSVIKRKFLLGT